MKNNDMKLLKFICLMLGFMWMTSCENLLDVEQQGSTSGENFYKTDEDAVEAIAAVYYQWRSLYWSDFYVKNLLSDDVYCGGGSRGDNANYEQINEYRFTSANSNISGYFSGLYNLVYRSNLIVNKVKDDSDVKKRVIAEAKVARGWAYFHLLTFWGTPPLVLSSLSPDEYQQPNGDPQEIWAQIEKDFNEAIESNTLPEKTSPTDKSVGARLTKQAAQAFLGKALLFEKKYADAATTLKAVINSGKYQLIDNYENILRAVEDFGTENIFELNSLNDPKNAFSQGNTMFATMYGWRSDKMNLWGYYYGLHDLYPAGWGFLNPTKDTYDAFFSMESANGYRLNATMKTYAQVKTIGAPFAAVTINPGASLYGHEGYFDWKYRLLGSEVVENSYGFSSKTNFRVMRYAEVLLMAAEACLLSNDVSSALSYINQIRTRAQLGSLSTVTIDDIKKEKRLELWMEGTRFQDLVRWSDAATVLANQGQKVPIFDGTNVTYPYTNTVYGFKAGKHELLPFPEHEMNVNKNIKQNPGW